MCEIWEKWVNQIRSESFENGKEIGFENGKEIGFENGEKTGQKSAAISAFRDLGKTREETTAYIIEKLHLTREQAQEAIQTYW